MNAFLAETTCRGDVLSMVLFYASAALVVLFSLLLIVAALAPDTDPRSTSALARPHSQYDTTQAMATAALAVVSFILRWYSPLLVMVVYFVVNAGLGIQIVITQPYNDFRVSAIKAAIAATLSWVGAVGVILCALKQALDAAQFDMASLTLTITMYVGLAPSALAGGRMALVRKRAVCKRIMAIETALSNGPLAKDFALRVGTGSNADKEGSEYSGSES